VDGWKEGWKEGDEALVKEANMRKSLGFRDLDGGRDECFAIILRDYAT